MKKFLYAAVAALAITTGANAADVITEAPPAPAAPIVTPPGFTWDGFYLGANVGYGWADSTAAGNDNGFVAGGQVGYNFQWNSLVLGLEADVDATGMEVGGEDIDYTVTGRARLGYAIDRILIYGTGGVAYAEAGPFSDTGWTAGAGIEWAATDNIIPGIEYLHYDFNDFDSTGVDVDADVIRARISFKF